MCTHTHTHTNGSDSHSVQALLYIATDSNPEWLGDAPLHAIAHQIAHSHGPSGSNWHYLSSLGTSIAVTRTHARTHARPISRSLAYPLSRGASRDARHRRARVRTRGSCTFDLTTSQPGGNNNTTTNNDDDEDALSPCYTTLRVSSSSHRVSGVVQQRTWQAC